ncbi:DUF4350 domain-containing protein [Aquisalimonas lutea]|uniref:GldG family protein n=1 Tax=Aquisalimonas lutea TaxID=1327750 RepID=UPI0025B43F57|nr:DUF4350 domain-containing protein [Aquisalimonas lutea]MDN3516832.1 DUF4350 domain-containing protein [Aquisalimonas lutea]
MNRRTRLGLHLNSIMAGVALLVVLALLAWLSARYPVAAEWSTTGRGELAEASITAVNRLQGGVEVVAFVRPDDVLARHARRLVARYQRHHPQMRLRLVDPGVRPELAREFGVQSEGALVVSYQGRHEQARVPTEPRLTAALGRLLAGGERTVVYPVAHGERDLAGEANRDLGRFGDSLEEQGYSLRAVDALASGVPGSASLLVVAGPRANWSEAARTSVRDWLERGGDLLWLVDDEDRQRLDFLAQTLGVRILPGRVVEPRAEELLGVDNPRLLALGDYPAHPALQGVQGVSLFPGVRALETTGSGVDWESRVLLRSDERHWQERQNPDDPVFDADAGERRGPLDLGLSLSRPRADGGEQRVVVLGDADFLANAYLGNGANDKLGRALVDWLTSGGEIAEVPGPAVPDQTLALGRGQMIALGAIWLVLLPGIWLAGACWAWWRRLRG